MVFEAVAGYSYLIYNKIYQYFYAQPYTGPADAQMMADLAMDQIKSAMFWGSVATIIIVGGTAFIWSMYLTHRYEGPLVSINRQLKELAQGRPGGLIRSRKSDEMKFLVETVNELTAFLHGTKENPEQEKPKST